MQKNKTTFDTNIWITYFSKGRFAELTEMIFEYNVIFFRITKLSDFVKMIKTL